MEISAQYLVGIRWRFLLRFTEITFQLTLLCISEFHNRAAVKSTALQYRPRCRCLQTDA